MSRDELRDVLSSIYEEKYSGSNKIVLYYQKLIRSPDSSQAKVLKVYQKLLMFGKALDQGRTPRLVSEQIKELNVKIKERQRMPPENKGMRLFMLLAVKSYYVKYTN
jgi:peptide subunit release factor 1 (eRF1)